MIFNKKTSTSAFTLIEIMLVIAVIGLITLGATRLDFNRLSDQQRIDIFTNEIVSKLETVRNNALNGKGIGINLETPDTWEITISNTSPGSVQTRYDIGGSWTANPEYSIIPDTFYTITNLNCIQLDNTTEAITGNVILNINKNDISLSGCSDSNYKILEFTTSYKNLTKTVSVNTLSGLIEVD